MTTTEALLILLGFVQLVVLGIGGLVLLTLVNHGQEIATLKAEKENLVKGMDALFKSVNEIKDMLGAVLGHRRSEDR